MDLAAALALHRQGNLIAAEQAYRHLIATHDTPDAWGLLGMLLAARGDFAAAADCGRRAIAADPESLLFRQQLLEILLQTTAVDEAAEHLAWLRVRQMSPPVLANYAGRLAFRRGVLAQQAHDEPAALQHYAAALQHCPHQSEIWNNYGQMLHGLGRPEAALLAYERALALDPAEPLNRYFLGMQQLATGAMVAGWANYQARHQALKGLNYPHPTAPRWQGEALAGRTLMVADEQGMGDNIMAWRYLPILQQRGATLIYAARPPFLSLLRSLPWIHQVVSVSEAAVLQPNYQALTLDLPHYLPGLPPPPSLAAAVSRQPSLSANDRMQIGLIWRGNPEHVHDWRRSLDLSALLAALPRHHNYHALVYEPLSAAELALLQSHGITNQQARMTDFAAQCDVLASLDGLVTIDSALVHLAGTLGLPTWLILPLGADWRWGTRLGTSDLYPSISLLRQIAFADWRAPLEQLAHHLSTATKR